MADIKTNRPGTGVPSTTDTSTNPLLGGPPVPVEEMSSADQSTIFGNGTAYDRLTGNGSGAGGVELENDGVEVSGGPFDTLDLVNIVAADLGGHRARLTAGSGAAVQTNTTLRGNGSPGSPLANAYMFSVMDYGATGDGVTDDTEAIQACIDDALAQTPPSGVPTIWFPMATVHYLISKRDEGDWCLLIDGTMLAEGQEGHVKIAGDMAKIRYPSLVDADGAMALRIQSTNDLHITGLWFIGDNDPAFANNSKYALYLIIDDIDVTVDRCTFDHCSSVLFGTDGNQDGRLFATNLRCLNSPNALTSPFYSTISNCYFFNDELLAVGGSHFIYIFGPAYGCNISGCVFKNCHKEAIQIRASEARYNLKRGFTIVGNYFEHCAWGVWCGSDSTVEVGSATITGNEFLNCAAAITGQGLRDSVIANNTCDWTWESDFDEESALDSAISVSSGGAGHPSIPSSVRITGNKLIQRHPFFGTVKINALPTAGQTITIGTPPNNGRVYTWTNSVTPALDEVTIGANVRISVENLGTTLRGQTTNGSPMNRVLRDEQDSFWSLFDYDSETNLLIIASRQTFAMSTNSPGTVITAVVDNRLPGVPILVNRCMWPVIAGNTVQDFQGSLAAKNCVSPVIEGNLMAGSYISGQGNAFPQYRNNRFVNTPTSEVLTPRQYRYILCGLDGFVILDNNALTTGQEGQCLPLSGKRGIATVGDGRAKTYLFFGVDDFSTGFSEDLPFSWQDGDNVFVDDGATEIFEAEFKRIDPDPDADPPQFGTAQGLVDLINNTAALTAAFVPFVDIAGTTTDPEVMIEIKAADVGAAANDWRLFFTRTITPNQFSYRTIGQLLRVNPIDGSIGQEDYARFIGGSAIADQTVIFSQLASNIAGVRVQGVDAGSAALDPVVYQADVLAGVAATLSHTVAVTGEEAFFYDFVDP